MTSTSGCDAASVSAIRRSRVVTPDPGGPPTATRDPLPNGAASSPSVDVSRSLANTGVRSSKRLRSGGGSALWPFTVSTWISDG